MKRYILATISIICSIMIVSCKKSPTTTPNTVNPLNKLTGQRLFAGETISESANSGSPTVRDTATLDSVAIDFTFIPDSQLTVICTDQRSLINQTIALTNKSQNRYITFSKNYPNGDLIVKYDTNTDKTSYEFSQIVNGGGGYQKWKTTLEEK